MSGQQNCDVTSDKMASSTLSYLQRLNIFHESFFLVLIEKTKENKNLLHMWKIAISSEGIKNFKT